VWLAIERAARTKGGDHFKEIGEVSRDELVR
jgi:hypothetical protein